MALPLSQKQELVTEIKDLFTHSEIVLLTQFEKMSVGELTALREKLRPETVRLKVYKNTLVRRAMQELDPESDAFNQLGGHLKGHTALAFSPEKPLVACKLIADTAKDDKRVGIKAAYFEGRYVDLDGVKQLASIGSKDMLIARLIGALKSPVSRLVNSLKAPQSNLVGVLRAVADKQEKG